MKDRKSKKKTHPYKKKKRNFKTIKEISHPPPKKVPVSDDFTRKIIM